MSKKLVGSTVLIGITGSIAAYKAIELAKLLIEDDIDIEIVLSKSAPKFISTLSLQSLFPGKVHLYDSDLGLQGQMLHISLAKKANLVLIAPASANTIAKLAAGGANCLLSSLCLVTKAPIMLAPAMNQAMWANSLVQGNITKLQEHGFKIIGPDKGQQACGDFGYGRMIEPIEILDHVRSIFSPKLFKNKKIVITAGPTREKIDPVRFLSNYSSGKMGYAIARIAQYMGADVTLISGPTSLPSPFGVKFIKVESADEMFQACLKEIVDADIFIGAAAVADYTPATYHEYKMKKNKEDIEIQLKRNIDIIATLKNDFPKLFCVGFAAETNNIKEYGYKKLKEKQLDMIAINDVSDGKVFAQDYNELHVISKDEKYSFIERSSKDHVAEKLLQIINKNI